MLQLPVSSLDISENAFFKYRILQFLLYFKHRKLKKLSKKFFYVLERTVIGTYSNAKPHMKKYNRRNLKYSKAMRVVFFGNHSDKKLENTILNSQGHHRFFLTLLFIPVPLLCSIEKHTKVAISNEE